MRAEGVKSQLHLLHWDPAPVVCASFASLAVFTLPQHSRHNPFPKANLTLSGADPKVPQELALC